MLSTYKHKQTKVKFFNILNRKIELKDELELNQITIKNYFTKYVYVSPDLCDLLEIPYDTVLKFHDVVSLVHEYISDNKLLEDNLICFSSKKGEKLLKIFKIPNGTFFTSFNIRKYVIDNICHFKFSTTELKNVFDCSEFKIQHCNHTFHLIEKNKYTCYNYKNNLINYLNDNYENLDDALDYINKF